MIRTRVERGILIPIHRGVYAVGHADLTRRGRWMAAALAGGQGAVLSHRSAAMLWMLIDPSPSVPSITTGVKGRRRPGIEWHTTRLPGDETTVRDGIPATTVARTLLDLASVLDSHRLERAVAEAEFRRYADSPSLPELIDRHRGRRGLKRLRRILDSGHPERGVTRSPLEERFLRFLDARGFERPELNVPIDLGDRRIYVDCLFRSAGVVVELDGRAAHLRPRSFESDRLRDRRLTALGLRPVRVTTEQLDRERASLTGDLEALGLDRDRFRP